ERHQCLWFGFGHAHHGFTLGPFTGRLLAEMMTGREPFTARRATPPAGSQRGLPPDVARQVPRGKEVGFAMDSPLEGDGFEPPVPREMTTIFEPSCSGSFKIVRVPLEETDGRELRRPFSLPAAVCRAVSDSGQHAVEFGQGEHWFRRASGWRPGCGWR